MKILPVLRDFWGACATLMVGCKCLGLFRRAVEPEPVIFKALCAAIGHFRVLFSTKQRRPL